MREVGIHFSMVNFECILSCDVSKKINQHGQAVIRGYIESSDEKKVMNIKEEDQFEKISVVSEHGESEVIFAGVVESVAIEKEGGLIIATITLAGGTRLLQGKHHTRTFQNRNMTYQELLKKIENGYANIHHVMHVGKDKKLEKFIVQYQETDWTFIKRMASHFHEPIITDYHDVGIRFRFGLQEENMAELIKTDSYKICNDIDDLYDKKENHVSGITKVDAVGYEIKSRELLELGAKVIFQNKALYVYEVTSHYDGSELIHIYKLKTKGGFRLIKKYNKNLIGASLDAKIIDVAKDTVKICITVDGKQDKGTAQWFPYSTVYSSPDGSGWYCMPEPNDRVRIYFPNEKEEDGYVISSIHMGNDQGEELSNGVGQQGQQSKQSPPRSNPDNKSISTKYNKQVEFTPSTISITNNKGMSILIDDNEGIHIVSDKNITIQSVDDLSISSEEGKMSLEALELLELKQGDAMVRMDGEITVQGAKFKIQQ